MQSVGVWSLSCTVVRTSYEFELVYQYEFYPLSLDGAEKLDNSNIII